MNKLKAEVTDMTVTMETKHLEQASDNANLVAPVQNRRQSGKACSSGLKYNY